MVQTRVCQSCGCQDTESWIADKKLPTCNDCGVTKVAFPSSCRQCGAGPADCCVLSYAGCKSCRPEAKMKGKVRRVPAAGCLAKSALAFTMLMAQQCVNLPQGSQQPGEPSLEPAARAGTPLLYEGDQAILQQGEHGYQLSPNLPMVLVTGFAAHFLAV